MTGVADEQTLNVLDELNVIGSFKYNNGHELSNIMNFKGDWTTQDYLVGDTVVFKNDTYVCIVNTTSQQDPSDDNYWTNITTSRIIFSTSYFYYFGQSYAFANSTTWNIVAFFVYQGSDIDPMTAVDILVSIQSSGVGQFRLYDNTNNNQLCIVSWSSGSLGNPFRVTITSFTNIPTGVADIECQIRRSSGAGNVYVQSTTVR